MELVADSAGWQRTPIRGIEGSAEAAAGAESERNMSERINEYHRKRSSRKTLLLALSITGTWFLVELIAGLYTNSLALLADAGHMLTDLAALSLSYFALRIAARPATPRKTFGYLRAEILAALANGVFLVLIALYIFFEAYHRLLDPPVVKSGTMLSVAVMGLVANLCAVYLLHKSKDENLNLHGAFLHVLGDTLGSIGAIVAGLAMVLGGWYVADPIVSIAVGLLILFSSWTLLRESVEVLLESVPSHLCTAAILTDLGSVQGVLSVHDLHVWSITSGMPAMSCHVVLGADAEGSVVLARLSRLMREKHGIEHTTIQIEKENLVLPELDPV